VLAQRASSDELDEASMASRSFGIAALRLWSLEPRVEGAEVGRCGAEDAICASVRAVRVKPIPS